MSTLKYTLVAVLLIWVVCYIHTQRKINTNIDLVVSDWIDPERMPNALTLYPNPPNHIETIVDFNLDSKIKQSWSPRLYYTRNPTMLYIFPFAWKDNSDLSSIDVTNQRTFPHGFDQIDHFTLSMEPKQCAVVPCGWHVAVAKDVGNVGQCPLHASFYEAIYPERRFSPW